MRKKIYRNSGKTLRKYSKPLPNYIVKFKFENFQQKSVHLFNQSFFEHVPYSTKKKHRWTLSLDLLKEANEGDQEIVFTIFQCLFDQVPKKTAFLYDSVLSQQFGSLKVSDRRFSRFSINGDSLLKSIKDKYGHTKRERQHFEKLKNQKIENKKKSRKHHRHMVSYIPEKDEELLPNEDHIQDMEKRKNSVHINEYICINNRSREDFLKPYYFMNNKSTIMKLKAIKYSKRKQNSNYDEYSENEDIFYDEEDDYQDFQLQTVTKPFIINISDILEKQNIERKRPRKRKRSRCKSLENVVTLKEFRKYYHDDEIQLLSKKSHMDSEPLETIEINVPFERYYSELQNIVDSHSCWLSATLTPSILVDFDKLSEFENMYYIILKPVFDKYNNIIKLKIILNLNSINIDRNMFQNFSSLEELIDYTTKRLKEINLIKSTKEKRFLQLNDKIEDLPGLLRTQEMENKIKPYQLHQEWKNYELKSNYVSSLTLNLPEIEFYILDNCEICLVDCLLDDMIVMNKCQHKICKECFYCHVNSQIESKMLNLTCPGTNCQTELDCVSILSVISWKRYSKRLQCLENSVLQKSSLLCEECKAIILKDTNKTVILSNTLDFLCTCGNILCGQCGSNQHWSFSCQEILSNLMRLNNNMDDAGYLKKRELKREEKSNDYKIRLNMLNQCLNNKSNVSQVPCCGCAFQSQDVGSQLSISDLSGNRSEWLPLNHKTLNQNELINKMKSIFNPKSKYFKPDFDVKHMENQLFQLMRATELILVKVDQIKNKKLFLLTNYLKKSGCLLIFYQNQIRTIVESVEWFIKTDCDKRKINESCIKIRNLLIDAESFIEHLQRHLEK